LLGKAENAGQWTHQYNIASPMGLSRGDLDPLDQGTNDLHGLRSALVV